MVIQCEVCQTQYQIDDKKIGEKGVKVKCFNCKNIFKVMPKSPEPQWIEPPFVEEGMAQPFEEEIEEKILWEKPPEERVQTEEISEEEPLFGMEEAEEILKLRREAEPSRIPSLPLILSLIFTLLFLVSFYYRKEFQGFLKARLENLISPKLEFSDIKGYVIENVKMGKLIVIKGIITNVSKKSEGSIKVKANLYSPRGRRIKEKFTYAGNVLPERELRFLSVKEIEAELMKGSSSGMRPGQHLQFMVVFPPMEEKVEEFNVEVTSSR